jgi:hypothetical protein
MARHPITCTCKQCEDNFKQLERLMEWIKKHGATAASINDFAESEGETPDKFTVSVCKR